ncbi:vascular endothelial growth factor receptor 1-like [Gastrophryne carolinensis]
MNTVQPGIADMNVKANELVIPCRVTSPVFKVTLRYFGGFEVIQPGMEWDPKIGFTISSPHYSLSEILRCVTTVNGEEFSTLFWKRIQDFKPTKIIEMTAKSTALLVGDTLSLLCVGEVPFNSRVILEWVHRGKVKNQLDDKESMQ